MPPPRGRRDDGVYVETDLHHIVADTGFVASADGRRQGVDLQNVRAQKRARMAPTDLHDDLAGWTPVGEQDMDEVHAVADTVSFLDIDVEGDESSKRKRYASSVSTCYAV